MAIEFTLDKPINFPQLDNKVIKKGFRSVGREVTKIARKNVSRRGVVSKPGEFPGLHSGQLRKTIKARVSRSGFSVLVKSFPTEEADYPYYVFYGHRAPYADRVAGGKQDRRQHGKKRVGDKVAAPRANWITAAADTYERTRYGAVMNKLVAEAIKSGVILG